MDVKQAKDIARQWVHHESPRIEGFYGAYFVGSINWMPDEAAFPLSSDIDVIVIYEGSEPPGEHCIFPYCGIIIEVNYQRSDHFQSAEEILGNYPTACHFTTSNIIDDPSGQLTKIHQAVAKDYARRKWVYKRCEHARDMTLATLTWLKESDPLHDQVFNWLIATLIPAHILLVAGLKNPTVRKGLVAARELLTRYGQMKIYPAMLDILGSTNISRAKAESHLNSLAQMYDVAKNLLRTPFYSATEISDDAQKINIEGMMQWIEQGDHKEAMYWIAVIYSFCQKVLYNDASKEVQDRFTPAYMHLLSDLGIHSFSDLKNRNKQNEETLPVVWSVAEAIIATTSRM